MTSPRPGSLTPGVVALVPVIGPATDIGLLLVTCDDTPGAAALPGVDMEVGDATWQDALVRAVREQAGLSVRFETHVETVSSPTGQVLIFGQTRPVGADEARAAPPSAGVRVIAAGEQEVPVSPDAHARVVARWFADRSADERATAIDRRCAVTGRRAGDAETLVMTDLERAVRALNELVAQSADFGEDQYACTLLDRIVCALIVDQRDRWGERGSDLLLTFLWHPPRDQLPVDEMFDHAAAFARAEATADPAACFEDFGIDRARTWMDRVALTHGLGRVMAPFHAADPVGLVRTVLGFGRFGRLEAKLHGDTGDVLTQLDEAQWEGLYVALGDRNPAALAPTALHFDELIDCFADVLADARAVTAPQTSAGSRGW